MPARRWLAAVVMAGTAAVVAPAASAAAAAPCIASGTLPAHVALRGTAVVVRSVLHGSSTCHDQRTDNGATATLRRPGEPDEQLRWRHFGSVQKVKLYIGIDAPGRYRLDGGDVQLYGHDYRQVDYRWRNTSMVVKRAGRFISARAGSATVRGRAEQYTKFGWRGYRHVRVSLQQRRGGQWRAVAATRADRHGRVRFAAGHGRYRLSFAKSARVWGARSGAVRG